MRIDPQRRGGAYNPPFILQQILDLFLEKPN